MDNAIFRFPKPINEPVKAYAPGSSEKASLKKALAQISSEEWDIPLVIGGKEIRTGNTGKVVMPHDHHHVLATYHKAGEKEVQMAIDAAMKAHKEWSELPWVERASIMLRVAELLATKYRYILNASVMLGQSKNPFQAEIDAPCELIDFLRFSTFYASQVYADQPYSETGILNRMEYRALEGFVFSLTPFNFTSIASNLNMAPAMMGNVAVWKPSTTAIHSNYFLMKVFQEAGLPDGVVNFIPGQGSVIGKVITGSRDLAGFHFTGSTSTFNTLWRQIGENLGHYKSYPKIVGETGGKNFIFAHPSAPALDVATAIVRGAFEYQGQKCSACSRVSAPLRRSRATASAPSGYPPVTPSSSADAPAPPMPKSLCVTGESSRPSSPGSPSCCSSDESIKNGSSDGTIICAQRLSPARALSSAACEQTSSAPSAASAEMSAMRLPCLSFTGIPPVNGF